MNASIAAQSKPHTIYRTADGEVVPSVTTVLGVISKPFLYRWHNRTGLQGIDTGRYVEHAATAGTCAHAMIHADIMGEDPEREAAGYGTSIQRLARNGFGQWLEWRKGRTIEPVVAETPLVSERHRYGGTIDFFGRVDGVLSLLDFKTSDSGVWPEMRHQVAAYYYLLEELGYGPQDARIIRVGKTDGGVFEVAVVDNLEGHFEMFLAALRLFQVKQGLEN